MPLSPDSAPAEFVLDLIAEQHKAILVTQEELRLAKEHIAGLENNAKTEQPERP